MKKGVKILIGLEKVGMYFLNKVIAGAIADAESNIVEIKKWKYK